ncbi:MAG: hypothetical protein R3C13_01820 [Hyphomonas sp.]|uniref:hypothetical protein n=1 Tax=Hyphomonas sp. TaxID=87 RepID=UPI003526F8A3
MLIAAAASFEEGAAAVETQASVTQEDRWSGYAALGYSFEGRTGVELEIGARYKVLPVVELGFSPANLVFYENTDDQYYDDTFSNGQDRCRDSSNGRFVDDAYCAPDVAWRGTVTGESDLGDKLSIGGGYLFGDQQAGFGSLRYNAGDHFSIVGRGGEDYATVALVLNW